MFVRKVRTASGAVAVQVMRKAGRRDVVVEHVGSAHTDAELGVLLERARRIATGDQDVLDFEVSARTQRVADVADWRRGTLTLSAGVPKGAPVAPGRTAATSSRLLYDVIGGIYHWVGFDVVDDAVRVLGPRIVARHDREIREPLGDSAHHRPLAAISVTAAAEHHDQSTLREWTHGEQSALECVGRVSVIAKDGRALVDTFEATGYLREGREALGDDVHAQA